MEVTSSEYDQMIVEDVYRSVLTAHDDGFWVVRG